MDVLAPGVIFDGVNIIKVVCRDADEAEIVAGFLRKVQENLVQARASGALRGDEPLMLVYKAVLRIAAEQTSPTSDSGKALLANLRHFI